MSRDEPESVSCGIFTVVEVRDLSIKLQGPDEEIVWAPKSQLMDDSEIQDNSEVGDEGELCLPEWLATEKGLT